MIPPATPIATQSTGPLLAASTATTTNANPARTTINIAF
jgi:hypothetical protein